MVRYHQPCWTILTTIDYSLEKRHDVPMPHVLQCKPWPATHGRLVHGQSVCATLTQSHPQTQVGPAVGQGVGDQSQDVLACTQDSGAVIWS